MKVFLSFLFLFFVVPRICIASDYNFASIEMLVEQEVGRSILPEFYKKIDITISITPLPGKRAQVEATQGRLDGEIMRIWSYGEENRHMVRVPTAYYQLETMAFVRKEADIVIQKREDLGQYSLVKVRGVKHTNNITKGMRSIFDIHNTEQMMRYLAAGRADIALTNTVDGIIALNRLGYTNITTIDQPLASLDLYHYIHPTHADLVPRIDRVIKEMKSSGELDALIRRAEASVIGAFLDSE